MNASFDISSKQFSLQSVTMQQMRHYTVASWPGQSSECSESKMTASTAYVYHALVSVRFQNQLRHIQR